jgi:hypothetical protein
MGDYTEKEKILMIFSICYLHFYSNFTYENTFTFEDYFNQNLINLCTKFNVFVKDIKQFKIFCYSFYYQLIKEIKNANYARIKNLYLFYNASALEDEKLILGENFNQGNFITQTQGEMNQRARKNSEILNNSDPNILSYFKNYVHTFNTHDKYKNLKSNLQKIVNKKIMTPLISTTERVVDMVLSVSKHFKYIFKN